MKYTILKIVFVIWIALWISFIARELFRKGYFYDYTELLSRDLEGKRSYVTGDRFYAFLEFCNKNLPEGATYELIGTKEGSIDIRRATYYLYPNLEAKSPDFILVYDTPGVKPEGYDAFLKMDDDRYILKKRKEKV